MTGDDCTTLQLTPAECAEFLTPVEAPAGAGWLIVALALACVLALLLAGDDA